MRTSPIQLITISREYGAGGSSLAAALGERLGWRVIDRELVAAVAERLQVPAGEVERRDEHVPTLAERIAATLLLGSPELPVSPVIAGVPDPDAIAAVEQAILREAVRTSLPLIIVGHGAQCLFRDRTDALHVRAQAPLAHRRRIAADRLRCTAGEAEHEARREDAHRRSYLRRHFGCEWSDPHLYDLVVNTAAIAAADVVAFIAGVVAASAGAARAMGRAARG